MSDLLIRDMPDHLKDDIVKRAKETGRSLSEEAKELLRRGLVAEAETMRPAGETAYDSIRLAFAGAQLSETDHADLMRDVVEGRRDTGRLVGEPE